MKTRRINAKGLALCILIALFIVLGAVTNPVFSDDSDCAYAADAVTPNFLSDKEIALDVDTDTTKTYLVFDQAQSEANEKDSAGHYVSGDFYSANAFTSMETNGNAVNVGSQPSAPWYCDIKASENLKRAICDPFMSVSISLYAVWNTPAYADGSSEKCIGTISYYSGNIDSDSGEAEFRRGQDTVSFNATNLGDGYSSPTRLLNVVTNGVSYGANGFIRLIFENFETGYMFSIAWKSLYVQVEAVANTMQMPEISTESVSVYDSTGLRNTTKTNLVKAGDIVVVKNVVKKDGIILDLPQTSSDINSDGYFYSRKYLEGSTNSPTFIMYDFNDERHFKRLYEYTFPDSGFAYEGKLDLTGDFSGSIVILEVLENTDKELPLYSSTWRKDGKNTGISNELTLVMDNTKPNQPMPETDVSKNVFYSKYFGTSGKAYYTDEASYVTEKKETSVGSGVYNDVITGVDLNNGAVRPTFTDNSVYIESGGTDLYIYCRAMRINTIPVMGESSKGFDPHTEGQLYCRIYADTGFAEYSSLILSLVSQDSGGNTVYNQSGFYSLEFVTVDEAGNYNFCPSKQYMKVDVSDYTFECRLILGLGAAAGDVINMSDATPYFATIKDDGSIGSYVKYSQSEKISFKRGAKVVVKMKMTSNGYSKYILTNFKTGGSVNMPTIGNVYENYATVITGSQGYTFEVNSTYSSDPATRQMQFIFKQRAYISVLNTVQTYTGGGLKVMPIIKDGTGVNAGTVTGNVKTTYATSPDGPYTETLPTEKGVYYYKCELLNHSTYYATTENDGKEHIFRINAATPKIEPTKIVIEEIKYGQSLAEVDFIKAPNGQIQDFNKHIKYVSDTRYYYDRSADGIIGYYMLVFSDKTSLAYVRPDAGETEVSVRFVPIKAKDGSPVRDVNGGFIRDENYNEVNFTSTVTVRRSTEVTLTIDGFDEETGRIYYDYDENAKAIGFSVVSALAGDEYGISLNEYAIVLYRDVADTEYFTAPPVDAGEYRVRIELKSNCNYVGGDWEYDFVIAKRKLNVSGKDSVYEYQYEKSPVPSAVYGSGEGAREYPSLNYAFTYYYYDGNGDYSAVATEENLVPQDKIFAGSGAPQDAGSYVVKMTIDEKNYENVKDAYALMTIKKVTGDNSNLNSRNIPTVKMLYADSHINYLQPLKAVALESNANTGVKYTFHDLTIDGRVRYESRSVEGYFILSYRKYRAVGYEEETAEEFVADSREYLGYGVGRNTAYICFIPSGDALDNFEPICRDTEITVGRAKPLCTGMSIENITYLTAISSVDDLVFVGNLRFATFGEEYKEVLPDDPEYGYSLELNTTGTRILTAGKHYIEVKIIPTGTKSERIEPIIYSFILEVEKYALEISLSEQNFDTDEGAYVFPYGGVIVPGIGFDKDVTVKSEVRYFNAVGQETSVENLTVGTYDAVYKVVDDNYFGEKSYKVKVIKADLTWSALPNIYEEGTAVAYNRLMSDVSFNSGVMSANYNGSTATVKGKYYLDYPAGERFTATGVARNYRLRFVPDDSENYNEYGYVEYPDGKNNGFYLVLTVMKEDVSNGINVSIEKNFVYGELSAGFDINTIASYTTSVYVRIEGSGDNVSYVYSDVPAEGYSFLSGYYSIADIGTSGYVDAGEYAVTFTIDDPNYRGSKTAYLVVEQKLAEIIVAEENKVVNFNNMSQTIKYVLKSGDKIISETVSQTFYSGENRLASAPTLIGKYRAELSLRSRNYYAATVSTDFTIRVDEALISVNNTEQVYSVPRQVSAVIRLIDARYAISFMDKLSDDAEADAATGAVTYTDLPVNAGEYWIRLVFDAEENNGYGETIVYGKPLVIEKYTATISAGDSISVSYTGMSNSVRVTTVPYGLSYRVEYMKEGTDFYVSEEILDANSDGKTHFIKFTVEDANYRAEKTVLYRINPVALTEESVPSFYDYEYNFDEAPALKTQGVMSFGVNVVTGSYSINVDDIRELSVGVHKVGYTFVAEKEDLPDGNFLPYHGVTELTIVRRRVSADDFVIGEKSGLSAEYNGSAFNVDAYVKEGVVFAPEKNSDFTIKVYYNGQTTLPKEPGSYKIRAEISSINYIGEKTWENVFTVTKGTPVITVLPVVNDAKTFAIGDTFTSADLKEGSGFAVIKGTSTQVRGSFTAKEKTFTKANANDVSVTFAPYDSTHFNSVKVNVRINVKGTDPFAGVTDYGVWDGAIITEKGEVRLSAVYEGTAYYGVKAGDFVPVFTGSAEAVAYVNGFGIISVSDPDYIPGVGGMIAVEYTPIGSLADTYNIMHGYLSVDVEKTVLVGASIEYVAYRDRPLSEGEVTVKTNGKVVDIPGMLILYDGETEIDMSALPENKTYSYRYVTENYCDVTGTVEVNVKNRIDPENIIVDNLTKSYDGEGISPSDMSIRVINTETVVVAEDVRVTVYKNGAETDSCATGVYQVKIIVDNGSYYGEKVVEFTITKRNVSDVMSLDFYSAIYGKITAPSLLIEGEPCADYTIYYKEYGASDSLYGSSLPDNAGKYSVKVAVDDENSFGEAIFDFVVSPRRLILIADAVYTYDYGRTAVPSVAFKETDSETLLPIDYVIRYYSDVLSMGEDNVLPVNAGRYTARVVLADGNYSLGANGYAEFVYEINKLAVTIKTLPTIFSFVEGETVYNLKYGQSLSELSFGGGEAKYNDETVNGVFRTVNPSFIPEAGAVNAEIEFVPGDSNYSSATESVTITVARADASVTFSSLQAAYTGFSAREYATFTVSPAGIRVKIEFSNALGEKVEPIDAGGYVVTVTSLDKNYNVTSSKGINGEGNPIFVVAKASVREVIDPKANPITVGESLNKSTLTSGADYGKAFYYGFNNAVEGKFEFVERSLAFKNAGDYRVGYTFTPSDDRNYAVYTGSVTVTVNKAVATVKISGTEFVYSEGFKYPVFKTEPENLTVRHDVTFLEYDPKSPSYIYDERQIVDVGAYYFHAWIEDDNYYSETTEFCITIDKKQLDMDFYEEVDGQKNVVLQYLTTYGKILDAKIMLYPAGTSGKEGYLIKDEIVDGTAIYEVYDTIYESTVSGGYYGRVAPTAIGTYKATATLKNKNYYAKKEIIYKIESGKIEEIYFDSETMENQVYGSVVAPIITTRPANVKYYIVYQGYNTVMPTDAGSYHITVYFDDENYEKSQISAMFKINKKPLTVTNITVSDKVYDGISSVNISGQLRGVLYGDEVSLKMTATTLNDETAVGSYYVDITSCKLGGLQAMNYDLVIPQYYGKVNITTNKVNVAGSSSFITSASGFDPGTTVEFNTVNSQKYKTSFFEKVTGRDSKVVGYTVKVNGADTIIKDSFKVYLAIPQEYLNAEFEVKGAGSLEGQEVVFSREGDYITFYTSSSGQVVFTKTEFRYEFVVIVSAGIIAVVGIFVLLILNPLRSRRRYTDGRAEREAVKRIKRGY